MDHFQLEERNGKVRFLYQKQVFVGCRRVKKSVFITWFSENHSDTENLVEPRKQCIQLYVLESELADLDKFCVADILFEVIGDNEDKLVQAIKFSEIMDEEHIKFEMVEKVYNLFKKDEEISYNTYKCSSSRNPFGRFAEGEDVLACQIKVSDTNVLQKDWEELTKQVDKPHPTLVSTPDSNLQRLFTLFDMESYGEDGPDPAAFEVGEDNLRRAGDTLGTLPEITDVPEKLHTSINKFVLDFWSNQRRKRECSQNILMHNSANFLALEMGISEKSEFEWLHVIAHRFGFLKTSAQQARNLVLGTSYANTQMMMIEEALSQAMSQAS